MALEREELTDEECKELRGVLVQLLGELEAGLSQGSDATETVDLEQPIGRVSRIDALQQQKMALEQRRRAELRRAQVKQALAWIEEDEYGFCRRCEEPIGVRRLRARPESAFCVDCRGSIEVRGR